MFYNINQPRTPFFLLGWLKLNLILLLAVISVDAYPFLAFSDLTSHLEDTGIEVFLLHCAV